MTERRRGRAARICAPCASAYLALLLVSPVAHAQDEGARAYELAPAGGQSLNLYGMFGRGNAVFDPGAAVSGGAAITINGGILEYAHGFVLAGSAGTWLVSLPFGEATRSVSTATAARTDSRSGIGDLQLTAVFGLVGSPALREEDYETYRPRVAVSLLTRLYVPTGSYDPNSAVNLGQNRWAVQLGLPMAYYLGTSFLDPALTSFELIPSVIAYGDNDSPPSGNVSRQAPLVQLEGHISRNLNHNLWLALDALLIEGGETTTDGVSDHNRQRSVAFGATGSLALSDAWSATLSYTQAVTRNTSGVSGHVIRLIASYAL